MAQPSAIRNFEHVQLQVSSRPIENILPSNRKFPPCFCAETHAAERSPTPIAEHALARRRAKARPQHNTAERGAGVHVILLRTETDKRRSLPMTPDPIPAQSSAPGLAGRDARRETARPAADAVAKVLTIALAGLLFLWTPSALSDSVATINSSSAPQTDGADAGTRAWKQTLRLVREAFPEVPQMTTRQLAAIRADGAAPDIVLLDARTAAEFKVSHLLGAVLASNTRMALDALVANDRDRTIVVYCSVGYRSSRLAEELRARGFENVSNLEGSLFQWANEGRPLYRGEQRVYQAHPYDEEWGQLLDRRFWAD